jgi:Kae1-associated kinase Bud32
MRPANMVFQEGERLHLGAEAEVWAGEWMGRPAVRKQRRPRAWRHPDLDHRLGHRRMMSEARLMVRMHRAGVSVPALFDLDPEAGVIVMQRMPGRPLIEVLRDASLAPAFIETALASTGAAIRNAHRLAITHGDLSTNNVLIDNQGRATLIDFGLAAVDYEVERFGIDLHVVDEILGASHPDIVGAIDCLIEGYKAEERRQGPAEEQTGGAVPTAAEVLKRLDDVRSRVRYHG